MSSEIFIYIKCPRYMKKYFENHFGDPVRFPRDSPENKLIKRFLTKRPYGYVEEIPTIDSGDDLNSFVRVEIPYFKENDPRQFNFLHDSAKNALLENMDSIITNHLWTDLLSVEGKRRGELSANISAWCETHGIDPVEGYKEMEAVRQKFYRLRKKFREGNNVKLS